MGMGRVVMGFVRSVVSEVECMMLGGPTNTRSRGRLAFDSRGMSANTLRGDWAGFGLHWNLTWSPRYCLR